MFCCWRTAMRCPGEGRIELVTAQDFTEHNLAGGGRSGKRSQEVAVEAAHLLAQHAVAKRNLDCSIEFGITMSKPTTLAPPSSDCGQNAADLAGPGQRRRSLERRGAQAFLVDRDDDSGRGGRIVARSEHLPSAAP